jgi:hypothetical protein
MIEERTYMTTRSDIRDRILNVMQRRIRSGRAYHGNTYIRKKESKLSSVIALICVNLFPVFGVLYWGWDVFPIMLLFWSENVIIGFYNVMRMIACEFKEASAWIAKLFMIPFFIVHYGGFTAAHGIFVFALFGGDLLQGSFGPRPDVLWQVVHEYNLFFAVAALFLSHGYSFVRNYLGKGEYRRYTLSKLMGLPYGRVVLLHITLIFGGFLIAFLQSPTAGLLLFILLKIVMDLWAHVKEHREGD